MDTEAVSQAADSRLWVATSASLALSLVLSVCLFIKRSHHKQAGVLPPAAARAAPTRKAVEDMRQAMASVLNVAAMSGEALSFGGTPAPIGALPPSTAATVHALRAVLEKEVQSWEPGARVQAEA